MKNLKNLGVNLTAVVVIGSSLSASADALWNGSTSSDWANPLNWNGGLPSTPGVGNTIVNPGSPFAAPTVSSYNYTIGQTYISIGAGLNVVTGGQLFTSDFVTGVWGNSAPVNVSGGLLSISGILNMAPGGFDGDVIISGGQVSAQNLSINTLGGAGIDISGSGTFVTSIGQLGNVNYWIGHNNITANGGAPGWGINVDTASQPGSLVLSAVIIPEPATAGVLVLGLGLFGIFRRKL